MHAVRDNVILWHSDVSFSIFEKNENTNSKILLRVSKDFGLVGPNEFMHIVNK